MKPPAVEMSYLNVVRFVLIGVLIGFLLANFLIIQPVFDAWSATIDALDRTYAALGQCAELCASQNFEMNCTIDTDEFEVVQV